MNLLNSLSIERSLSRQFVILVFCASTLISVATTSIQLFVDYRRDINLISESFETIETSHLPALLQDVWSANSDLIQTQLNGLLSLRDISYIAVEEDGNPSWVAGEKKNDSVINQRISLIQEYRGQRIKIGDLHIQSNLSNVYQRLIDKLLIVLVTNAGKAFLVSLFILVIFHYLIGRRLKYVADKLSSWEHDPLMDGDGLIDLNFPGRENKSDEIDQLVSAFSNDRTKLRNTYQEVKLANQSKSEFLASMSHEIRTPMTAIMGLSDLLLVKGSLNKTDYEHVEKIHTSTSSLLTILNDILDLSKLDSGKLEMEKINFNPSKLANNVALMFDQTCPPSKKEKLRITSEISPEFPTGIFADPVRLRQVLVNLVGNAVKFTDEGSVTLFCEKLKDADVLKFRVVDTGIGIDQETQKKLFGDFVQADASISRKYEGTGLGLSICKRLVKMMGGEIGIDSERGSGSTFWFTQPFEPLQEGSEIIDDQSFSKKVFHQTRRLSILVAEDNDINQTIIQALLERMGHQSTFANNGAEAVEAVKSMDFDLILMDVRMPELSGPDATKQIRFLPGSKGQIPIIAVTADVMAENRQSYLDAGMNDCVGKPINQEELVVAINTAMGEIVNRVDEEEEKPDTAASFSLEEVKARLGLPDDLIASLLETFASDYADVVTRIEGLVGNNDLEAVRELSHELKGVAGSLGMPEISALAALIETEAKNNNTARVEQQIPALASATTAAVKAIKTQAKTNNNVS